MTTNIILFSIAMFIILAFFITRREKFNIPFGQSSAWGWNTGPGYGEGYGTGYGIFGFLPRDFYNGNFVGNFHELGKRGFLARMPRAFYSCETPMPQIDYGFRRF